MKQAAVVLFDGVIHVLDQAAQTAERSAKDIDLKLGALLQLLSEAPAVDTNCLGVVALQKFNKVSFGCIFGKPSPVGGGQIDLDVEQLVTLLRARVRIAEAELEVLAGSLLQFSVPFLLEVLDFVQRRMDLLEGVTYGLGTANESLPSFVILTDYKGVNGGAKTWSSGFLPASYQGTPFQREGPPILNLDLPETVGMTQQRSKLDFLASINWHHSETRPEDTDLDARIESYELAYRMQSAAPEAVDLDKESEATKKLYGMDEEIAEKFGSNCLLARRLVERGVRFVEAYCGSGSGWDAHEDLEDNHGKWCKVSDKPIAGLLTDLEARGLLDDTLVVWGGEFGRTPFNEKGKGRDHNPWGFTIWMAGAGIEPGQTVGATDELGFKAADKPYHVHDIHATILHLLGLNHLDLTYFHNGRAERATVNGGKLIKEALA